jgi:hypothetical protein
MREKLQGCHVYHVPPPSAEGKNEWHYISNHVIWLHGADCENITLFFKNVSTKLRRYPVKTTVISFGAQNESDRDGGGGEGG